jgi:riboflavin biosynthesis pyrimidine reductase
VPEPTPPDVPLDVLVPVTDRRTLAPVPGEAELVALLVRDAPHVRANMVASVDGAATGGDDRSGSLGTPADARVFAVLRALADVVLVGAGTVRAEGYRELPVADHLRAARAAAGLPDHVRLAVVTRRGDVPADLTTGARPPLVVTGAAGAAHARDLVGPDRTLVVPQRDDPDSPDLPAAVAALRARGLTHVLAEGGPGLLGDLLAADVVDELCLTTAPTLVAGPAPRVVHGAPWLAPSRPAHLRHVLHAPDGTLLTCWDLRAAVGSGA